MKIFIRYIEYMQMYLYQSARDATKTNTSEGRHGRCITGDGGKGPGAPSSSSKEEPPRRPELETAPFASPSVAGLHAPVRRPWLLDGGLGSGTLRAKRRGRTPARSKGGGVVGDRDGNDVDNRADEDRGYGRRRWRSERPLQGQHIASSYSSGGRSTALPAATGRWSRRAWLRLLDAGRRCRGSRVGKAPPYGRARPSRRSGRCRRSRQLGPVQD